MTKILDWIFTKLLTVDRATGLVLDWINKLLKRVKDPDKYEQIAGVVEKVAEAIKAGLGFVKNDQLRDALIETAEVIHLVSVAIYDREVTVDESAVVLDSVEKMVKAWARINDKDKKEIEAE